MKFFVPDNIYKERIAICKSCEHYLSLLGNCGICKCFMSVKARLAPMECAAKPKKWEKTTEIEEPKEIPKHIIDEVLKVWPDIKTGRAHNRQAKNKAVELYNIIHNTNHNIDNNCPSCLQSIYTALKKINEKYK